MACYNSELPIGPPGPTGPQGPPGESGNSSYKVYTALLTQDSESEDPPIATVLENTIDGTITFRYDIVGVYEIINSNGWDPTKTWYSFGGVGDVNNILGGYTNVLKFIGFDGNLLFIYTFDSTIARQDGALNSTPIEIRVYP
jgi:hypothetical protein